MPTCVGMTIWKRPLHHVEHLFPSESLGSNHTTKNIGLTGKSSRVFPVSLTPEQTRAARAWMDWTQEKFVKMAKVSLSTIHSP
jgi:hypothetical protein